MSGLVGMGGRLGLMGANLGIGSARGVLRGTISGGRRLLMLRCLEKPLGGYVSSITSPRIRY